VKDVTPIKSPNADIDRAIKAMMKQIEGTEIPPDTKVKIINTAINWEKVKHHIDEGSDGFDPNSL
jgi:hypothetical protein